MCVAAVSVEARHGEQRPLERHEVGDHGDGLDRSEVGVRPAGELVQVVADARDLAAPLALDRQCRRGPRSRPRHRRPQQDGRRHAGRRRLVLPGGMLRRRDAGGDHDGAAVSRGRTGAGVRGAAPPARPMARQRRVRLGVRRGAQHPLARPQCSTLRSGS